MKSNTSVRTEMRKLRLLWPFCHAAPDDKFHSLSSMHDRKHNPHKRPVDTSKATNHSPNQETSRKLTVSVVFWTVAQWPVVEIDIPSSDFSLVYFFMLFRTSGNPKDPDEIFFVAARQLSGCCHSERKK